MIINDDHKPINFPPIDSHVLEAIRALLRKKMDAWLENPNTRHEKFQASNFVGRSALPQGWDNTPPLKAMLAHFRQKKAGTADGEAGKCIGYILKDVVRKDPRSFEKSTAKVTQYQLREQVKGGGASPASRVAQAASAGSGRTAKRKFDVDALYKALRKAGVGILVGGVVHGILARNYWLTFFIISIGVICIFASIWRRKL